MLSKKKVKINNAILFLIISLGTTLAFYFYNIFTKGAAIRESLSWYPDFSDYFEHFAASSSPYHVYDFPSQQIVFPPLSYVFYHLLWLIGQPKGDGPIDWETYARSDGAMLILIMYNIFIVILLCYVVSEYMKKRSNVYIFLVPFAICVSYPFMLASINRGNSIYLTAIIVALAWLWIDDENEIKRELSLILIAIATGLKLCPAILGIELIRRKEWKRVLRLVIYGIIFIFVPFLYIGKLHGAINLINRILNLSSAGFDGRCGTFSGFIEGRLAKYTSAGKILSSKIGRIAALVIIIISIVAFFMCEEKKIRIIFISAILASFLPNSWCYTITYYLVALLSYISENKNENGSMLNNKLDLINVICLSIIFSCPFYCKYIIHHDMEHMVFYTSYVMLVLNLLWVFVNYFKKICKLKVN